MSQSLLFNFNGNQSFKVCRMLNSYAIKMPNYHNSFDIISDGIPGVGNMREIKSAKCFN